MCRYLIDTSKNITVFFARINSNKLTTKFLFCSFLLFYFVVNISVAVPIFINFLCKFIVLKLRLTLKYKSILLNTLYCLCLFSPVNKLIIFVSPDSYFVKMTSNWLNYVLVLNLCADVFLKSVITFIANFIFNWFAFL